jgi:predicted alpha-1,2-mannosidase
MKRVLGLLTLSFMAPYSISAMAEVAEPKPNAPVDWVDPTIESNKGRWFFCTPGSRPFGMVSAAAHTKNANQGGGGYNHGVNDIKGFTQVHAWQMCGGVNLMPTTGGVDPRLYEKWNSGFGHDTEVIKPGYHKVFLDRYKLWVEQTSTDRVALYRYRFTESKPADILMVMGGKLGNCTMAGAKARKVSATEVEGEHGTIYRQWGGPGDIKVFFVIRFSKPFDELNGWNQEEEIKDITDLKAKQIEEIHRVDYDPGLRRAKAHPSFHAGMSARYNVKAGDELVVKIGISFTSIENARKNLDAECPHFDFDRVVQETRDIWNEWLGKIEVKGGSDQLKTKFYTDLWHVLLGRHRLDDINGDYPDRTTILKGERRYMADFKVKTVPKDEDGRPKYHMYNSDGFWITSWNLNVLWGLGWPHMMDEMSASMLQYAKNQKENMGKSVGFLPRGPVGGGYSYVIGAASSVPLIASTYQKGLLTKVDPKEALPPMAGTVGSSRKSLYGKTGFLGKRPGRNILQNFEDWTLAQMLADLGETADAEYFEDRSHGWIWHYNPEVGLLTARDSDGTWFSSDPMAAHGKGGWMETNSWNGTWGVAHDIPRLAKLMGGPDKLADKLDHAFGMAAKTEFSGSYGDGYMNYSNQPSCSNAHVFNHASHPWLSQYWVRQISEKVFGGTDPDTGYGGHDEDQGQMGGVSALMKIGLFSLRGNTGREPIYEITTPEFDEVTIKLDPKYYSGREFKIKTYDNSKENLYIQKARLNGKPLDNCWFYHKDFAKGGLLELWLGPKANETWGKSPLMN